MHSSSSKILLPGLLAVVALAGCANLPGDRTTQTTAGGAAAGALAGAVLAGDDDQLLGAVLGGLIGAAAGHVIGAQTDWFAQGNEEEFRQRVDESLSEPATVDDVYSDNDADLNDDGLVTMDELIALSNAGLSEAEVLHRLRLTDQVFHVTPEQRHELIEAGVDPDVVYQLEEINRA